MTEAQWQAGILLQFDQIRNDVIREVFIEDFVIVVEDVHVPEDSVEDEVAEGVDGSLDEVHLGREGQDGGRQVGRVVRLAHGIVDPRERHLWSKYFHSFVKSISIKAGSFF